MKKRPLRSFLQHEKLRNFSEFSSESDKKLPKCVFLLTLLNGCFYYINIDISVLTDIPAEWPIHLYSETLGGIV